MPTEWAEQAAGSEGAPPPPPPRLFVLDEAGGGAEVLDASAVAAYEAAAAARAGACKLTQPLHGAAEAGSMQHMYMSQALRRGGGLPPLPLADAARAVPAGGCAGLPALRRPHTLHLSDDAGDRGGAAACVPSVDGWWPPALGLRLPQAAAAVPQTATAACTAGPGTLRVHGAGCGVEGGSSGGGEGEAAAGAAPAVLVREIVEVPALALEQVAAADAALARCAPAAAAGRARAWGGGGAAAFASGGGREDEEIDAELAAVVAQLARQAEAAAAVDDPVGCEGSYSGAAAPAAAPHAPWAASGDGKAAVCAGAVVAVRHRDADTAASTARVQREAAAVAAEVAESRQKVKT